MEWRSRLRSGEAPVAAIVAGEAVEPAARPEARAPSAGLILRAAEAFGILHVGRNRIQDRPALADHRLVDQRGVGPDERQHPTVAVGGLYVPLEADYPALREICKECLPREPPHLTLPLLGRVDPDEAHLPTVATAEGVPIDDMGNGAAIVLARRVGLGRGL